MNIEAKERVLQINKGLVPRGYKRTKLGIIPEDWSLKKLGSIARINKKQLSENTDSNYKFYYIDISCVEAGKIKYTAKPILFKNAPSRARRKVNINDIIMSTVRPNLKAFAYVSDERKNLICSTGFSVLSEKKETLLSKYIFYNLFSYQSEKYYFACVVGSNYPALNNSDVKKLPIPIPPLKEQEKIAEILSTCDKVIELKEKLIEQTKQQKKYLMHALLDPNSPNFRRLPGFDKEWKEVELGSLGKTYGGLNGKNKNDFGTGKPYIPYVNIFNNSIINVNNFEYVEIGKNENQNRVKSGDIFFTTSSETPEEVGMSSVVLENIDELYLNSFCFGFRLYDFSKLNPNFAVYFFRSNIFRKILNKLAQGSTRFNLSKNNMMKTNIILPTIREQTAIAKIISVADQGMEFLEKELEQHKLKKKALMQLLLTGKVRVNVS